MELHFDPVLIAVVVTCTPDGSESRRRERQVANRLLSLGAGSRSTRDVAMTLTRAFTLTFTTP